ncbi:hypothetical protein GCM10009809_14330 [Isoptericola hypogeus]|uniref:Gametolysin peptidase M11 n=1 Tax=Isoptericola hypogeus TaxID=300179 RepID=A0ABP4V8E5_9MICO
MPWESAVGDGDRARSYGLRAAPDRSTHPVDIVVATPRGATKANVGRWIRDADVDTLLAKVSAYWSQQSGGRIRFVRRGAVERIKTGDGSCTTTDGILRQVRVGGSRHYGSGWYTSSTRGPGTREHLVVLYPYRRGDHPDGSRYLATCGGTLGLGSVPSTAGRDNPGGWSFSLFGGPDGAERGSRFGHAQYRSGVATLAHELGHNLGLAHSGVGWCEGDADGSFKSRRCGAAEGLDPLDLMGADFAAVGTAPLSGAQKRRLGVLPRAETVTVTRTGGNRTVRIAARHRDNSLPTLVRAVDPRGGQDYFVELRPPVPGVSYPYLGGLPWRAAADYTVRYGVTISRVAGSRSSWALPGEHLIVPTGPQARRRSSLAEGGTFTTRTDAMRIKVVATSGTTARVRVTFPRS